ncbi:MAG: alkaline phosphatase D family protein [Bacteriovoracia bacterium]
MNRRQFITQSFTLFLAGLFAPAKLLSASSASNSSTFCLAFGSCADQNIGQPIWGAIARSSPDLFAFLGDNIYADTEDMNVMQEKYEQLARIPDFASFRKKIPIVATWDDHDFGLNDVGADYSQKNTSKKLFLDFFREPKNSVRRLQKGIYTSYFFGAEKQRTQLILLDLRWFRSALVQGPNGEYLPNPDRNATLLGEEQWKWLEEQLKKPADFRILGSSVQFASSDHRWEKWANFPREKSRLLKMLDRLAVRNLLVISGDMHFGEISRDSTPAGYPLYDFTSSGLNYAEPSTDPNGKRLALFDTGPNFGLVTVDWTATPPSVSMELRDELGATKIRKKFLLPSRQ